MLPEDGRRRIELARIAREVLGRAGYEPFETPIFEDTEVFARGVGESTDIVQKEMFTFEDKAGRSLTLRPGGHCRDCRAYIEHGMHKLPQPVKLFYDGPFFRHEAPQAGRYRQFTQLGAEAIGSEDPSLDAELILMLAEILREAGVPDARLRLSSLGTPETRAAYLEELKAHLRAHEGELSDEVRARIDQNPLRAFDTDHPGTAAVMESAPLLLDRLASDDAEHFAAVRALLDDAGVAYDLDPTLVRGLDYYTRTVFEFESRAARRAARGGRRRPLRQARRAARRPADPRCGLGRGGGADPAGGRSRAERASPSPSSSSYAKPEKQPRGLPARDRPAPAGPGRVHRAGRTVDQGPVQARRQARRRRRRDRRRRARGQGHGEWGTASRPAVTSR